MDKNRIFNLFSDNPQNSSLQEIHVDFMDSATAKIGMFVKLIQNNIIFNQKMKQFFKQMEKDFNEESTRKSSEFTVFNRAWFYIKDVNIEEDEHLAALIHYDVKHLLDSLKRAVKFFEELEEFEKCAHIHKIEKLLKEI